MMTLSLAILSPKDDIPESFIEGYYGLEDIRIKGILRFYNSSAKSENYNDNNNNNNNNNNENNNDNLYVKSIFITITGKLSTTFTDRVDTIDPLHRETTFLTRTVNVMDLIKSSLPKDTILDELPIIGSIFDIPFDFPFPEIPDSQHFPPHPPGTSASSNLVPSSAMIHGYQTNSPIHMYSATTKYELNAIAVFKTQKSLGGILSWTPKVRAQPVEIPNFRVYDPRLIPSLMHSDIRRWRSAPGSYPVEYDVEVGSICMGPNDTLRFSYKIKISDDAISKGIRLRSIGLLIREHHLVGEQRCQGTILNRDSLIERKGVRVKGYHDILRWEHVESPVNHGGAYKLLRNIHKVIDSPPGFHRRFLNELTLNNIAYDQNENNVDNNNNNNNNQNTNSNRAINQITKRVSNLLNDESFHDFEYSNYNNNNLNSDSNSNSYSGNESIIDSLKNENLFNNKENIKSESWNRGLMTGTKESEIISAIEVANEKYPENRPGTQQISDDGIMIESFIDLKLPEFGKYAPSTPKNMPIPPCPLLSDDPLPAGSEVRHTIQVWIDCRGSDKLVMESGCVMASVSKMDITKIYEEKPEILPNMEYEKLIGSDQWVPTYKQYDLVSKMVDTLDDDSWDAICAVLIASEQPQEKLYRSYLIKLKEQRKERKLKKLLLLKDKKEKLKKELEQIEIDDNKEISEDNEEKSTNLIRKVDVKGKGIEFTKVIDNIAHNKINEESDVENNKLCNLDTQLSNLTDDDNNDKTEDEIEIEDDEKEIFDLNEMNESINIADDYYKQDISNINGENDGKSSIRDSIHSEFSLSSASFYENKGNNSNSNCIDLEWETLPEDEKIIVTIESNDNQSEETNDKLNKIKSTLASPTSNIKTNDENIENRNEFDFHITEETDKRTNKINQNLYLNQLASRPRRNNFKEGSAISINQNVLNDALNEHI